VAKEWSLHWQHQNIRFKAKAFYYLCFYCEVIHKLSLEADLDQLDEIVEPDPLYRLLGQALKFLDVDDNLEIPHQLNYFLARTINYLGIKPDLSQCFDCQNLLDTSQTMFFSLANSSFYCESCSYTSSDLVELNVSRELFKYLVLISGSNYNKLPELYKAQNRIAPIMFQYICSQFQMSQNEFLTSSFVI
jgi:recombinational DNA repair protein (RecF pathway)